MSPSDRRDQMPDDLREVVHTLFDGRPTLDPLALDRVKVRAMRGARRSTSSGQGLFARSRLATLAAVGFLTLGTGGAVALAGGHPFGLGRGHDKGSASDVQYRPGNGFGDKNHCHTGPPGHTGIAPGSPGPCVNE
jgi:hypothetical protein